MALIKKRRKAFLIPTVNESNLFKSVKDVFGRVIKDSRIEFTDNGTLLRNMRLLNSGKAASNSGSKFQFYHIHITSDEKIKNTDKWLIHSSNEVVELIKVCRNENDQACIEFFLTDCRFT